MLNKQATLKAILGGALLLFSAIAQDIPSAAVHPNVAITAEFPKTAAGVTPDLVSGRVNNLKVKLHNSGEQDLIVKMIVGSVAEVKDFTKVTHNTLKAHSALVLPYTINITHPSRDVGLTLLAEIIDPLSALHHQIPALIYNSTVHFTQPAYSWFDWKLILGSMLMAGAITSIIMTAMAAKNKSSPKKQHEALMKDKNAPTMEPMDRHAVLARMKADDTPVNTTESKTDNTAGINIPKMSAMDRYAVLARMKADDGQPLPEPKTKPTTTTATTEMLTGGEPFGILSQMKALDGDRVDEKKDRNTEPESMLQRAPQMAGSSADRFEVLADMKATRADDVMNPDKNLASTRAL
ncbi:hypothetical protein K457DRAFT_890330 [Linnemannia elongata AG-77]|uniref:Translocon-associated protein subunit alpha n=1 Tax=Linnemannia elongata AG-77 TaxID=1314771 RepID=A0A197K269_9FUNG|nr:hypothetical protein K457DRAFT_890330 [Linnemannia elongata AG-77]